MSKENPSAPNEPGAPKDSRRVVYVRRGLPSEYMERMGLEGRAFRPGGFLNPEGKPLDDALEGV